MCDCVFLACFGACAAAIFVIGIYFFFGIIFTTLAIRAKNAINSYNVLLMHSSDGFPESNVYLNLCITIGVFFTCLTLLGFAGEKKGRKIRLVYAGAQLVIIILGLIIYIGLYPNERAVEMLIEKNLNNSLYAYGVNTTETTKGNITAEWDKVQTKYQCCGIRNYLDWDDADLTPPVPVSCCREEHRMKGCSAPVTFANPYESNKIIYVQGCFDSVRASTLGQVEFLDYFLIPILVVTCFGFVISCCSSGVKKDDDDLEVKKVGPIMVRRKTSKKKADKENDVENPTATEAEATELPATADGDKVSKKVTEVAVETV